MSEAVNAIIRYAFAEMGAKNFQITHAAGNVGTRSVMDKLGFTETNIRENAHNLPSGKLVDEYVLTLADIRLLPDLDVSWD
jgi:RimJ/RimL family protein N-acetyltransferase